MRARAAPESAPPVLQRVLYHLRFVRLGPEWREWIERDVARPSFVVWTALFYVGCMAILAVLLTVVTGETPWVFVTACLAGQSAMLAIPRQRASHREAVLSHHRRKWERQASP